MAMRLSAQPEYESINDRMGLSYVCSVFSTAHQKQSQHWTLQTLNAPLCTTLYNTVSIVEQSSIRPFPDYHRLEYAVLTLVSIQFTL